MNAGDQELERAHARIASLERILAGPPETSQPRSWPAVLRGCALAAAILVIAGIFAAGVAPRSEVILLPAPPPPPTSMPPGELEVFSPRYLWDTDGPALVDVESKGSAHDLVVLAWRRGHADQPMHVVALRRSTYEVLWRSEGLASPRSNATVSLVAIGERIAVSDAAGDVHVLDVHTGHELRAAHAGAGFERIVTRASEPDAVFAVNEIKSGTTYRIDLGSGDVSPSPLPARSFRYECRPDRARACRREPLAAARAKLRKLVDSRAAEFGEDLVDEGDRITVFDTAPRPQLVDYQLFAWDAGATKLLWKAPAVPPPRRALQAAGGGSHDWLALANHRLVAVYLVGSEGHRVSAHDAATGKLAYDVALPELPYGMEVERLTLDGDTGFITTTGALFVLDAPTGKITTTLRRF